MGQAGRQARGRSAHRFHPRASGASSPSLRRESLIAGAGLGLFATAPIAAGEVVCHYRGTVLSLIACLKLRDRDYVRARGRQGRPRRGKPARRGRPRLCAGGR